MLDGRVALVTGGARGIGREAGLALARAGCAVAVNYRTSKAEADAVAEEISARGGRSLAIHADVSQEEDVNRLVREVEQELGPVDVLVNNAGIGPGSPLSEVGLQLWNRTIAANLTSAFLVSQAVVPGMRERRWGRLLFLSSVAAQLGGVIGPHYAASKAGMVGMMHSYANLLAAEGITSNALAPALIETEMVRQNPNASPLLLPVKRYGTVQEAAELVLAIVSNAYLTGQTISLNGGWYMTS